MGTFEEATAKILYIIGWALATLAVTCYFLGKVLHAEYLIPGAGFEQKVKWIIIISAVIYIVLKFVVKSDALQFISSTGLVYLVLLWIIIVLKMLICRLPIISGFVPQNFGQAVTYIVTAGILYYISNRLDSSNNITDTIEYLKTLLIYKW